MKVSDLTVEEFEALIQRIIEDEIEDLYFLISPAIKTKLAEGLEDIEKQRFISFEDYIKHQKE